MKTTLKDDLIRATKAGEDSVQRAETKRKKAAAKEHDELMRGARQIALLEDYPAAVTAMKKAASRGDHQIRHEIVTFADLTEVHYARADTLIERLKQEGLQAKRHIEHYEPFGSDPYYPYSADHLSVEITW